MKSRKKIFINWTGTRLFIVAGFAIYVVIIWPPSKTATLNTTIPTSTEAPIATKRNRPVKELNTHTIIPVSETSPHITRLITKTINDDKVKSSRKIIESQGYGSFPEVDMKKSNPHKTYVFNALQDPQNNPNVASIIGKRIKFDPQRYSNDPSHYLSRIEPGRAFAAAAPGPNVTPLARIGHASIQTQQNKPVILEAKGQPGMPVSFTVFDGGIFSNGLGFTSLKADDSGIARAQFTPTSGVINQVRIRASSPVNSGTLQWNIFVNLENKKESTTKEIK